MPDNNDLTKEDQKLWEQVTKDVTRLKESVERVSISGHIPAVLKSQPRQYHDHKPNLEKKTFPLRQNSRKEIKIEARLDLHGCTQTQAYDKLVSFLTQSQQKGKKRVLVITGKGAEHQTRWWERTGVLREVVPRWLAEEPCRSRIISYDIARPEHGGSGALYILLKRLVS